MDNEEVIAKNDNEIDLIIFTNIDNGIKNSNYFKKITKKLDDLKQDINYDIKYTTLEELEKNYEKFIILLKDIPTTNNNELKWGVMEENDKYKYIGQFNGRKRNINK